MLEASGYPSIETGVEVYRETATSARYELVRQSPGFSLSPFREVDQGRALVEEGLLSRCDGANWETYAAWVHKSRIYLVVQQSAGLDRKSRTVAKRLYVHFEQGWQVADYIHGLIADFDSVSGEEEPKKFPARQVSAVRLLEGGHRIQDRLIVDASDRAAARRVALEVVVRLVGEARVLLAFFDDDCRGLPDWHHFSEKDLGPLLLMSSERESPGRVVVSKSLEEARMAAPESAPVKMVSSDSWSKSELASDGYKFEFLLNKMALSKTRKESFLRRLQAPRNQKVSDEIDRVNEALRTINLSSEGQALESQINAFKLLWLKWQECEADGNASRFRDALDSAIIGDEPRKDVVALVLFIRFVVGVTKDSDARESLRTFATWVLEHVLDIEIPEEMP